MADPTTKAYVNIIISTKDHTSPSAKKATKSLSVLKQAAKAVAAAYVVMRVAQKAIQFLKLGGEGIVLRNPDSPWLPNRVLTLLKW